MGDYAIGRVDGAPATGIGGILPGQHWPRSWSIYFGVTNAEATIRDIEAAGGVAWCEVNTRDATADAAKAAVEASGGAVPHGPFETPYGRVCVVQDPQGATVSLIQLSAA